MASPSIKFKKALCSNTQNDRRDILWRLSDWLTQQTLHDPNASACVVWLQQISSVNSWADNKTFKSHFSWDTAANHDRCISFQEIVKAKLAVPQTNIAVSIKEDTKGVQPRRPIPKKVRGEVWKNHFGSSTVGSCYCCKKGLDAFEDWHAGHIIARVNGGGDVAPNLRPVCGSCNLSMGSENMDEFKMRCYPG